jgi:rfaE bifunctional protein nucleotidyltransferase chain/domain
VLSGSLAIDLEVASRIVTPDDAARAARDWQREGHVVALTNGCFDLLHVGHLRYLQRARSLGQLIVGVNSDASVRALKGKTRPIVEETERAEALASLRSVSLVTIFDDLTAERLLMLIRPNVYVKGADYGSAERPLPEARIATQIGARVALVEIAPGHSTSALLARIRDAGR